MHWTIALLLLSTVCKGSHVIEEVGEDDKSHLTEEQKEKFMDIISKYEYDSTKLAATEIIERFSQCVRNFNDDESKGWGWTSTTSPTCVSVGHPCTGDWRNLTDAASDLSISGAEAEKGGGWSSHAPGWNSPPSGWPSVGVSSSTSSKTCCNKDMCTSGYCCTPTPAYSNHSVCTQDSHCCGYDKGKSICDTTTGICKIRLGANCTASNQCINGNCNITCCIPNGSCQPSDSMCTADNQCCNGTCADGKCMSKQGSTCCGANDCTPPATCTDNMCCIPDTEACTPSSSVCCTGICNSETMTCNTCAGVGDSCITLFKAVTCCTGKQCVMGKCLKEVSTGMCNVLTDICIPPDTTECKDGMCCSTSGNECSTTGKCCDGGLCTVFGLKSICA